MIGPETKYIEIRKNEREYLLPKFQIFVKEDLTFRLRCYGWVLSSSNTEVLKDYTSMRGITLSNLIIVLEKYQLCKGVSLVEFKEAVNLQHHMIPRNFDFSKSEDIQTPLCQDEYLRSRNYRLVSTVKAQREENKALRRETKILQERLKAAISADPMAVNDDLNNDLVDIFKGIPNEKVPPFMRLFWEEQQKYIRTKHESQIRYHPAIIKFCLSIASKSSSAYEQLRLDEKEGTGCLVLPSQRTLRDYRNYIKPKQGFNPKVIKDLTDRTKNFSDSERYINILIDEMKIQEDLVWNKHTGELIGFIDLGDENLNESLLQDKTKLATHIMVFMAKSLKNPLSFAFANFATDGATSEQIFSLYWKADDDAKSSDLVYKVKNMYSVDERYIFFFADVPHLIKTARNCLWASGSDFSPRFMWNSVTYNIHEVSKCVSLQLLLFSLLGSYLLWAHVKSMFYEDMDNGLKLMPKITTDHILLNSYSKMRVHLACCRNLVRKKPKELQILFANGSIFRLFIGKKVQLNALENFPKLTETTCFMFPTYNGIKISITSLKEIIPYLLANGFDYILTEKFCQDNIENYFGRQRAIGHRKDNPTAKDSLQNDNIIKSQFDTQPIAGKRKAEFDPSHIQDTPLKK
ncbi:uncharacterized protein [Clytia hemisphaerica]|uniref:uncharacterized protein n=1 Tax=Clytia hemisphaerica TaxID=252671 RepID=UPI0034D62D96